MLETNPIDALEDLEGVYSHLAQATDDIQSGRLEKADSVFENLLHELENYEVSLDSNPHQT